MSHSRGSRWLWPAVLTSRGGALGASLWLGLWLAACQAPEEYDREGESGTGQAGAGPTGAAGASSTGTAGASATGTAGASATGTAGTSATGTAGSSATGAAGTSGTGTGGVGTSGTAGRGGMMGTGMAGRGGSSGTSGTTGAAGRGGTTGAGGTTATGTAGTTGRGGTSGTTGRGGRGGTTGTAGATGTAGTTGSNTCPAGGKLDCTAAGVLPLPADGQIVDFSAAQWNSTTARWCDASGLDGGLSSFAGTGSTAMATVDATARNLKLNLMVAAGGYAGGRVNFDSCVDARTFDAVQFTASVTAGSLTGCAWQIQLQTQNQRPSTSTPMGGTCNATTTTCERYPAATLTAATATSTSFTVRFSSFNNPAASTVPSAGQIVGLQWQVNSNGGACTVELRVDNIKFVSL